MTRDQRILDGMFWLGMVGILAFALIGCAQWQSAVDALSQTAPDGTGTILSDGIESIPAVVSNPFDLAAWGKIVGVLIAGGAGLFGYRYFKSSNAAK